MHPSPARYTTGHAYGCGNWQQSHVAAALVVGLGCDHLSPAEIAEGIAHCQKPVDVVTIEKARGFQEPLELYATGPLL
jgi:altronate dehydratase